MTVLTQASRQWMSRPADERFTSLTELYDHARIQRALSHANTMSLGELEVHPIEDDPKGLVLVGAEAKPAFLSHFAFGQMATLSGAPAGYMRDLPAPLVADCMNFGLDRRRAEQTKLLVRDDPAQPWPLVAAATGPKYGRIWNSEVVGALVDQFGDGVDGQWRVPGEFGQRVEITKENTTFYGGEQDMFVFLADEERRIEMPDRRNGQPGQFARGFFCWNSEVGAGSMGGALFIYDYVCRNRMVWGVQDYSEFRIRHTSGAPDRWINDLKPAITAFAQSSEHNITQAIEDARASKLGDESDVAEFLAKRFTKNQAQAIMLTAIAEEGRPIETRWDAVTAATAYARGIDYQDQRVALERTASKLLVA